MIGPIGEKQGQDGAPGGGGGKGKRRGVRERVDIYPVAREWAEASGRAQGRAVVVNIMKESW